MCFLTECSHICILPRASRHRTYLCLSNDFRKTLVAAPVSFEPVKDLQRLQEVASFIKDAGAEEITQASDILTLVKPEIQNKVEMWLEELFGNLKKSKLADWPRLLEHCPTSFDIEKHSGVSMAMDFAKAVKKENPKAVAEAAKRILASGQNFETLVKQDGFIFPVSEFNISAHISC